ncbi:MAG: threonine synthase [Betaproteobacteria bacterium]|nr:threonine synthase [Betaproteobacteria bacterium]
MKYISTRGPAARGKGDAAASGAKPFCDILLEGLAPDGGLAVPQAYPRLDAADLRRLRPLGYRDLAFEILSLYIDDIAPADLRAIVDPTYTKATFRSDDITPLKLLEPGLALLQLSHGPTLAFKDVAMQLLGNLFEHVLGRRGESLNILGATSGDTGSAAEYAMRGKKNVRVFMLSPLGKMSPFQAAQMYSLQDPNIFNIAVRGVFDEAQDIVKAVSNDLDFKAKYRIGSVNSINWARLVAQVVYYFKGYFAATKGEGEEVSFSVPTGNFGNIFAGYIARRMGLPVRRLVLATNENNVLEEFFDSGAYRVRKSSEVFETSSPSMDISKASNFERYMHDIVGGDGARVRELWAQVDHSGQFDLAGTPLFERVRASGFVAGHSTHSDRVATIRDIEARFGYVVDTHTADGIKVGLAHREPGVPLVCLETALAAKFDAAVREAVGRSPDRPAGYENIERLPQRCEVMDADAEAIKAFIAARVS